VSLNEHHDFTVVVGLLPSQMIPPFSLSSQPTSIACLSFCMLWDEQVVLAPIAIGMLANKYMHKQVEAVLPFSPVVGMVSTCLLVASAVGQCSQAILNAGLSLQLAALSYHLLGGVVGYFVPKLMGFSDTDSRTMAIETAMKSSAFGFLLAKLHFGSYLARVPPAVSVVWMAVTGSTLAVIWRYIPV